ncbi:MAG: hypothetical protein GY827_09880 [Cytophagales bacterium]|nr:hypothetical protein [Cytophagales bacterium]
MNIQKKIIVFVSALLLAFGSFAQSSSTIYEGKKFYSFSVKVTPENVKKFTIEDNKNNFNHQQYVQLDVKDNVFVAVASVVDANCNSLGFLAINGRILQRANTGNGGGNFYLKPNGAFLVTQNDIIVCETSQISRYQSNIVHGIQSGPMLLNNGQINSNFGIASPNKRIRSGVGTYFNKKGEKCVVFVIADEPVTFYEFASLFKNKYKCSNALCLESARSVMSIPYIPNKTDNSSETICRYIKFVF